MSESRKTKKFKLNPFVVIALVLCAVIALYCGTTAWITSGAPVNPLRFLQLQDFEYTIEVSTDNGATWSEETDAITFSADEINNLQNIQVRITQNGNGIAFARVRMSHEWKLADGSRLQSELNLPFLVNEEDFYDNRDADGYVYFMGDYPIGEAQVVFSGFDATSFDPSAVTAYDGVTLSLDVTVDAVQFNRYEQLWGIDTLPWRQ